jgi:hypothetical protein
MRDRAVLPVVVSWKSSHAMHESDLAEVRIMRTLCLRARRTLRPTTEVGSAFTKASVVAASHSLGSAGNVIGMSITLTYDVDVDSSMLKLARGSDKFRTCFKTKAHSAVVGVRSVVSKTLEVSNRSKCRTRREDLRSLSRRRLIVEVVSTEKRGQGGRRQKRCHSQPVEL